jgi:hypothetical protein
MKCCRVEKDYLPTSGILAEGFIFTGMLFKLSSPREKQTVLAMKAGLLELLHNLFSKLYSLATPNPFKLGGMMCYFTFLNIYTTRK